MLLRRISFLLLVLCCLSACKMGKREAAVAPAAQLYQQGQAALAGNDYRGAIQAFERLDNEYPFSRFSDKVLLKLIYAYYQNGDYASSGAVATRFIRVYPRHQHVDYAYFIKGKANFEQDRGVFAKFLPFDASWRDPGTQQQAYQDFQTVVKRFPTSHYAADARQQMVYLRNQFAQKELNLAQFYYDHKHYVAAANRASYLAQIYPQSPQAREGLVILAKSNEALGIRKPAADAHAVLALNRH